MAKKISITSADLSASGLTNEQIDHIASSGLLDLDPKRKDSSEYFTDILDRINNSNGSLEELYNSIIGDNMTGNNLSTSQREDLIKQMIDSLIAKRQLDEQRTYDNPSAQLERLMAAGMSKDAALQAIAGGAGSSVGSGSSLIGAAQSPAPSESYANEVQAKTSIANAALNGLQCAANLASFGISVPGQIANNTIAKASADATTKAQTALEGVNAAINVLDAAVDAGTIDRETADEASRSSSTLSNAIEYCARKDPNGSAAQFMATPQYAQLRQNPYSSRMAADRYTQNRSADDYAVGLAHEFKMRRGAELLLGLDIQKTSAMVSQFLLENQNLLLDGMIKHYNLENIMPQQLLNMKAEYDASRARTALDWQEYSLFGLRKSQIQSEIALNRSSARLNNANATQTELANTLTNSIYNHQFVGLDGKVTSGLQWLTTANIANYAELALTYYGLQNKNFRELMKRRWASDISFQATDATFKFLYQSDALRSYENYRDNGSNFIPFIHGTQLIFSNPLKGTSTGVGAAASGVSTTAATLLKFIPK